MKAYYYFLFRIYRLYKDKNRESDTQAIFSVTALSTVLLSFIFLFLYGVTSYFGLIPIVTNKSIIILFTVIVGCINYYLFVRGKKFMYFGFEKDKRGGFLIISFITMLAVLFITFANFNRDRVFRENAGKISNEPRKESLEGKIRKWFE